jgi:hypothetical protein
MFLGFLRPGLLKLRRLIQAERQPPDTAAWYRRSWIPGNFVSLTWNASMKTDRPVYLNLLQISLPLAGQVSFAHRVTGIVLFAGVAFGL